MANVIRNHIMRICKKVTSFQTPASQMMTRAQGSCALTMLQKMSAKVTSFQMLFLQLTTSLQGSLGHLPQVSES